VIFELFELIINYQISMDAFLLEMVDVVPDLIADTLGALVGYIILMKRYKTLKLRN
jgi:hypothetical protein